jgi:hypothetical protein
MRDMLESALEAARDAELCRNQLKSMPSGPVAEKHEARLKDRISRDEAIADKAADALFGERGEALTSIQRDVLFHRFVLGEPWKVVASQVGYSVRAAQNVSVAAMKTLG